MDQLTEAQKMADEAGALRERVRANRHRQMVEAHFTGKAGDTAKASLEDRTRLNEKSLTAAELASVKASQDAGALTYVEPLDDEDSDDELVERQRATVAFVVEHMGIGDEPEDLGSLNKDELQALAEARGLATSGTKSEIIARLEGDGE